MTARLRGRVVRLTARRLKDGGVRHDTRIEFDGDETFGSVRVQGVCSGPAWRDELLEALRTRYDLPGGLPAERWYSNSAGSS